MHKANQGCSPCGAQHLSPGRSRRRRGQVVVELVTDLPSALDVEA